MRAKEGEFFRALSITIITGQQRKTDGAIGNRNFR